MVSGTYGRVDSDFTLLDYQTLAKETGFHLTYQEDITRNTLPTYPIVRQVFDRAGNPEAVRTNAVAELFSQVGLLRYLVVRFSVKE